MKVFKMILRSNYCVQFLGQEEPRMRSGVDLVKSLGLSGEIGNLAEILDATQQQFQHAVPGSRCVARKLCKAIELVF